MKQIISIPLSSLQLGTHLAFHQEVLRYIGEATPAELKIETQAPLYEADIQVEQKLVNRPSSQRYTAMLATSDSQRDDALSVFINVVKAQTRSVMPEKKEAAQQLRSVIDPYNDVMRDAYLKETAAIRGLLAVLKNEKNKALVSLLHLDDEVVAIEETNGSFETLYEKSQEDAQMRLDLAAIDTKELRSRIDALYQEIVQVVNAFAIAVPSETISTFIDNVNGLIYRAKQEGSHTGSSSSDSTTAGTGGEEPVVPPEN